MSLMDNGEYESAIAAFEELGNYKDSKEVLDTLCLNMYGIHTEKYYEIKNQIDAIKVGDTYFFGEYEQDDDTSNGKEEIEWKVLEKDGYNLLLISKEALDRLPYNNSEEDVTWESCSLRRWLNEEFLSTAFSEDEIDKILTTTVTADRNPKYDTEPGNDTQDEVFLLSMKEVEDYGISDPNATKYTRSKVKYKIDIFTCWTRTPGDEGNRAACYGVPDINYDGIGVWANLNVRPTIWINPFLFTSESQ